MVLTEQKKVLNHIVSDVRHIKSALETIKKDQAKQNSASEDMMAAIKENAENIESNYTHICYVLFYGNRSCCACGYIKIIFVIDE